MNVDAAQLATNFATYDIQPFQTRYTQKLSSITSQTSAINQVKTALNKLEDAAYDFTKPGASVTQFSTTASSDEYIQVSTDDNPDSFDLDIYVKQLADAHQLSIGASGSSPSDVMASGGTLTVGLGGDTTINIDDADQDASGDVTYSEFVSYFNDQFDDSIQAVLVKSQGAMQVLFSAKDDGADSQFTLTASVDSGLESEFQNASDNPLQIGQDAIIAIGGKDGLELTNNTNTFEDIVQGVDITLKKVNQESDQATNVTVEEDISATMDAIQAFITEYNQALTDIAKLTQTGNEEESRGILASDSTIRSIESQLGSLIRAEYEGARLYELGIEIDRSGKLTLDRSTFEEASSTFDVEQILAGEQGLFSSIEARLDIYLDSSTGTLNRRLETLESEKSRVDDALDSLETRYQTYYNRYLSQFTQLNALDSELSAVSVLFTV
ncbi:flagellar filament capping protein FliD [Vibrio maritimus]|uniref:flagellar filament capping protein FliD n=1 Tax=Vibrio maritimus TaxID=990268 RepID=UPI0040684E27